MCSYDTYECISMYGYMYVCVFKINTVVILHRQSNNPTIRGFMIQGRTVANDSPIGFFIQSNEAYRTQCDGNVRSPKICRVYSYIYIYI